MTASAQTIWNLLSDRCQTSADSICCQDDTGRTMTFLQLQQEALSTAQALTELGIGENDRVAWQLPTWLEAIVLAMALSRLGAVQIPLFPTLRENELLYILGMARPKLLISPSEWKGHDYHAMSQSLKSTLAQQDIDLQTLTVDRGTLPQTAPDEGLLNPPPTLHEPLPARWIFCTSGTTSAPKAALHNDTPFLTVGYAMNALLEISSTDAAPIFFPFTHVGGLMWLASTFLAGNRLLLTDTFNDDAIRFAGLNGTTIGGAGTVFHLAYLKARRLNPDNPVLPDIRSFTGGGAPKPPDLHYEMKDTFGGAGIISGYGLTECPIISMNSVRDPDDKLAHTEGRLLPGMEIRIVGPNEQPCQEGEIRVKGPHLCLGFLDESLNESCFDDQGYFKTGDIGSIDSGGWLTITGRLKDVIIRKGENISAKKIEDLLYEYPAIQDVAVIGLPDKSRGELACAVIELHPDSEQPGMEAIRNYCLEQGLVIQEVPERLEFVDQLPRNASGKVLKNALQDQFGPN